MHISLPSYLCLELPAGFPQTINYGSLLLDLVITPPIRTKSEEEYQWPKKMPTSHWDAWTFICSVCAENASTEKLKSPLAANAVKDSSAVGKRAKHWTPVRTNPSVKLNLTDRTFIFTRLAPHKFLILAPNLTFGPRGRFWAAEDVEMRRVQGNCGDILCQSFQFREGFYCIHLGRGSRIQGRMTRQQSYTTSI